MQLLMLEKNQMHKKYVKEKEIPKYLIKVKATKTNPENIYLLKFSNRNIRKRCEKCSKLTIKTPECRQWCRYSVFIVNFEHVSHPPFFSVSIVEFEQVNVYWGLNLIIKSNKQRYSPIYQISWQIQWKVKN